MRAFSRSTKYAGSEFDLKTEMCKLLYLGVGWFDSVKDRFDSVKGLCSFPWMVFHVFLRFRVTV